MARAFLEGCVEEIDADALIVPAFARLIRDAQERLADGLSLQRILAKPPSGFEGVLYYTTPRFTAAAALQAAREGTSTKEVQERWIHTLAFADEPKNPAPREVMFTLHMAVGEDAFPPDVFQDLCAFADEIGVSPNRLATGILKQELARRRQEEPAN